MELNHHHNTDTMPGLLLTVTLWLISVALDIIGTAAGIDTLLVPILHSAQLVAAGMAVIVGACTISPKFKTRIQNLFRL